MLTADILSLNSFATKSSSDLRQLRPKCQHPQKTALQEESFSLSSADGVCWVGVDFFYPSTLATSVSTWELSSSYNPSPHTNHSQYSWSGVKRGIQQGLRGAWEWRGGSINPTLAKDDRPNKNDNVIVLQINFTHTHTHWANTGFISSSSASASLLPQLVRQ